ncbi:RNA-binding ribosome biosynthesis protein MRD1 [Sporobolomyces salmoneus]|uniref:RNA-binding ribosome biosynthesis protein MRD1 n=1 Tax=Sporobolomyces salmoneus TaxID=183962 RepID=UPI00317676DD
MSSENTRLLFTSLHPSVSSSHLRSHLSSCPSLPSPSHITDLKIVTRRDGTSRCIAFVGFKSGKEAQGVLEWSRDSWVTGERGGSKVKVDWAKDTRDAESLPANKRIKLDNSTKDKKGGGGGESSDSRFKEFLAVMAPPKPSTLHDTSTTTSASTSTPAQSQNEQTNPAKKEKKEKSNRNQKSNSPQPPAATTETETRTKNEIEPTEGFMSFPNDDAAEDETLTDAEYLAKRMKRTIDQVEVSQQGEGANEEDGAAFEQDEEESGKKNADVEETAEEETPDLTIQSILETGRLFLRNLAFSATKEDLESLFSGYGQLEQVHLPLDKSTSQPKGLAYITFSSPPAAVEAYKALDGRTFQGRLLHILPAVGRLAKPEKQTRGGEGNVLKNERMEMRKQTGGKAFSWGTLYLNSNAALSAVADRLGVSKAELLDPTSSSDPAIKVALAEAHTIGEIKQYFENEGVNITAFSQPGARSSTCILLKNLPYATTPSSLSHLFAPYGTPNRLLVPPSGTIAIVDMPDSKSASEAWRGLLYKQFGGSVLYLEKAPNGIWDGTPSNSSSTSTTTTGGKKEEGMGIKPIEANTSRTPTTSNSTDDSTTTPPGATLFIKNLNFITTSQRLQSSYSHLDGYTFSRVQTKPDPSTPGKTLSMGYGFVGFRDVESAKKGKEVLDGQVLDGHKLEVKFAQRGTTTGDSTAREKEKRKGGGGSKVSETTTKMLVKNVPFEATRKDLRQLFSAYGQLKSVRLPRKMNNTTRGFAFLDFATRRDAESAFSALEHAHLLGRHLVLQWAGEEDDPEGGGKGRGQFALDSGRKNLSHKKSKFTMDTE